MHEAHNGVLLALDYSTPAGGDGGGCWLASGGRDGLIHVYDVRVGVGWVGWWASGWRGEKLLLTLLERAARSSCPLLSKQLERLAGRPAIKHAHPFASTVTQPTHQMNYELVDTLDDHKAAVTGVRFAAGGKRLISCSADGGVVFRCVRARLAVPFRLFAVCLYTGC